jgi:DNA-binding transcriptional LysR family regulator
VELRHLRYFVTLPEELHFGRAAECLHIAQPPLRRQIQQWEAQLGLELFLCTKTKVELTTAGEVFLNQVQQILKQLEHAVQLGRQTSRGLRGQFIFGFVTSAAYV